VRGEEAPAEWNTYRRWVRQGLAGTGVVAAPTRAMLDSLADNYGYRQAGLVLPNGASGEDFAPARKQHCVLAAGRFWDAAKNLSALECVAPDLPWPVKVAGAYKQPDGGTVVPEGVQCLGELSREALAREYATAAIYALPARYEPFGLSVLEAALSGCALVLGDIPSLREIWGDAAAYVAPDDHAALRATLQRLVAQPAERTRLARAALARARHFTPARKCDGYLDAYARLAPRFAATATATATTTTAAPEELACA
jgi:glycosyltransferase involved in cell wall biosynthesis